MKYLAGGLYRVLIRLMDYPNRLRIIKKAISGLIYRTFQNLLTFISIRATLRTQYRYIKVG
uniref:Uncharacterized protein n=1 Tax=uncultured marine virus TaxID=186617 RepID=A0A0F7L0J5_9VIRU|nr:hypothetical protein [uncultured marine virus]